MQKTTDFTAWLDYLDLDSSPDEVYNLYQSVSQVSQYGEYNTQLAQGADERWIVTCADLDIFLFLGSELARSTFLSLVEDRHCEDMGIEAWYGYYQAMSKSG